MLEVAAVGFLAGLAGKLLFRYWRLGLGHLKLIMIVGANRIILALLQQPARPAGITLERRATKCSQTRWGSNNIATISLVDTDVVG